MRFLLFLVFLMGFHWLSAQEKAVVFGKVTDEKGSPLELVNVAISGLPGGTVTDRKGNFELEVPANRSVYVAISFVGFEKDVREVNLQPGERFEVNVSLKLSYTELP